MKRLLIMALLLLGMSLLCFGCRGALKAVGPEKGVIGENTEDDEASDENWEGTASEDDSLAPDDTDKGQTTRKSEKFNNISDISDYWNDLYKSNEEAINNYEGMPILELVTPGLSFVTGVQYDLLNIFNEDGRFEGNLMLSGYPGFEERKGAEITFGYEYIYEEEDGFSNHKPGDKKVENGNCDLDKGYFFSDSYTERDSEIISRSISEFKKRSDSGMSVLIMEGSKYDFRGEEKLSTNYIFIDADFGRYDFAVANSEAGVNFDILHLEKDMTKDEAIKMLQTAGATIKYSGGIKDGALYLD